MKPKKITSALISVFHKDGLSEIIKKLSALGVQLYSTGGTQSFIESLGIASIAVESITDYPSILDGRVKTLHPKIFGGLLAKREEKHLSELHAYNIPTIDLAIVDLYPFEQTVILPNATEDDIIEKIDIGGISLIRAAAKNYQDVVVVASKNEYQLLLNLLDQKEGYTDLTDRKEFARRAFKVSSNYDTAIFDYFDKDSDDKTFKYSIHEAQPLRYGENPHQHATFYGNLDEMFEKLAGKELSFNNLVDVHAAVSLMSEFKNELPTFAILKHNNACGVSTRPTTFEAWKSALASDPVSAFGGILICNTTIDLATAEEINQLFYEVLIAPDFEPQAIALLEKKKNRVLLRIKHYHVQTRSFKNLLNGVIEQDTDLATESADDFKAVTRDEPNSRQTDDMVFANKCVKHLKSNAIALAKNKQLLGIGCGQTSRVDALKQAIAKAQSFGFNLHGAVMASDAFFPFPDCVEIAQQAGIVAVVQPGGSIKDQESIDYCNENGLAMVITGRRHFLH